MAFKCLSTDNEIVEVQTLYEMVCILSGDRSPGHCLETQLGDTSQKDISDVGDHLSHLSLPFQLNRLQWSL